MARMTILFTGALVVLLVLLGALFYWSRIHGDVGWWHFMWLLAAFLSIVGIAWWVNWTHED